MGLTLDRFFNTPEGQEAPSITDLVDALNSGEGDWSNTPQQDPLSLPTNKAATGQPGHVAMDDEGFIRGRAAVFATPGDLSNYARTGSLATGDNGVGAWGDITSGLQPGVAVPRDIISKVYGSEDAGHGKRVMVIAPNGESRVFPILDKGPKLANRANDAVIELNPAARASIGTGDAQGYRYKLLQD